MMSSDKWVNTLGERLAMLLTLSERSGMHHADMIRLKRISADLTCAPERACITDFTDEHAALIMRLHMAHF